MRPLLEALRSGMPDPAIVESHDGSGYYVFATGHGVKVFHSADLLSWKQIGRVFDRHVPEWRKRRCQVATEYGHQIFVILTASIICITVSQRSVANVV